MSGGETKDTKSDAVHEPAGNPSEFEDTDDVMEAMSEGGRDGVGDGASTAKSLDGAVPETVEQKAEKGQK